MVNIELLKKLIFIADITKKLEPFLFNYIEIHVNTLVENSDDVSYAFQVLKIPFTTYEPEIGNPPDEINVCFGCDVELNIIYQTTYILKEIFGDALDIYISYATEPKGSEKKVRVGTYITKDKDLTNISESISAYEILKLDINNIHREEFWGLFPNIDYTADGSCFERQEYEPDYDRYDYSSETFNALTDGQYGDYEDFREDGGNFDDLMDRIGF